MNRRLAILKNTLVQKELGGSFKNWLLNTFSPPCEILSKPKITSVESEDEKYYKVFIKGYTNPLFLSKQLDYHVIQHVISEQLYNWHWHYYQIPETTVQEGEVVFDCGSAEGLFPFLTHKQAKAIYAFEPLPEYVSALQKTFLQIKNVTIVNEALGEKTGEVYFKKEGISSSISNVPTESKIVLNTIDNFCHTRNVPINYLKADIEGYEDHMLIGATNAIEKYKPKIAITVYHKENNVASITRYLKKLVPEYHFKCKGLTGSVQHPVMLHAWV